MKTGTKPGQILAFSLLIFCFCSCERNPITADNDPKKATVFPGKWTVVKDSVAIGKQSWNYVKTDSDYFDFKKNGVLAIREGLTVDTAAYTLTANGINIFFPGVSNRINGSYQIHVLPGDLVQLTAAFDPPMIAQGGAAAHDIIYLKR